MGAVKTMYLEAIDAVRAIEVTGESRTLWDEWVAEYADQNYRTPIGQVDDVYDVISDFSIMAQRANYDASATMELIDLAMEKLVQGSDPYDIQAEIDSLVATKMAQGFTAIGRIVLEG